MPWTPNLSVGVPQIDEQHKVWFEKAEKLFEAGQKRQAAGYIGELLGFLDDYTRQHFADEEKYMLSINYPEYAAQKQAHTAFIAELEKSSGSLSPRRQLLVIMNANKLVIDWLTKHISNMDKKIGEYAKQQKS